RTSQCNAMGVGHACRDPRLRPSYSTACVTSPLKTWLRNDSALLSIAGDSACRVDPVNRRKLNSINCVRGGRRYRLRAQGDFCAIAFYFYLLLHLTFLADKLYQLNTVLAAFTDAAAREEQRLRLFPFPFSALLIGRPARGSLRLLLGLMV